MSQAFLTGIPIVAMVRNTPQAYYLVMTFLIFLLSMVVLLLIFLPKMLMQRKYSRLPKSEQRKMMTLAISVARRSSQRSSEDCSPSLQDYRSGLFPPPNNSTSSNTSAARIAASAPFRLQHYPQRPMISGLHVGDEHRMAAVSSTSSTLNHNSRVRRPNYSSSVVRFECESDIEENDDIIPIEESKMTLTAEEQQPNNMIASASIVSGRQEQNLGRSSADNGHNVNESSTTTPQTNNACICKDGPPPTFTTEIDGNVKDTTMDENGSNHEPKVVVVTEKGDNNLSSSSHEESSVGVSVLHRNDDDDDTDDGDGDGDEDDDQVTSLFKQMLELGIQKNKHKNNCARKQQKEEAGGQEQHHQEEKEEFDSKSVIISSCSSPEEKENGENTPSLFMNFLLQVDVGSSCNRNTGSDSEDDGEDEQEDGGGDCSDGSGRRRRCRCRREFLQLNDKERSVYDELMEKLQQPL